jgi:hypothetical protein
MRFTIYEVKNSNENTHGLIEIPQTLMNALPNVKCAQVGKGH